MKINEEQAKRVLELEEEFSDKSMEEIFPEITAGKIAARRKLLIRRCLFALLIFVVFVLIPTQFFAPMIVDDRSMKPMLNMWDCVLISKKAYVFDEIRLGDIVAVNGNVRRVAGLPGDLIEIRGGGVYRNGDRVNGAYADGNVLGAASSSEVPELSCFVIFDNNNDDNVYGSDGIGLESGFIAEEGILGKVVFRLLPVSKIGRIH